MEFFSLLRKEKELLLSEASFLETNLGLLSDSEGFVVPAQHWLLQAGNLSPLGWPHWSRDPEKARTLTPGQVHPLSLGGEPECGSVSSGSQP